MSQHEDNSLGSVVPVIVQVAGEAKNTELKSWQANHFGLNKS